MSDETKDMTVLDVTVGDLLGLLMEEIEYVEVNQNIEIALDFWKDALKTSDDEEVLEIAVEFIAENDPKYLLTSQEIFVKSLLTNENVVGLLQGLLLEKCSCQETV